MTKIQKEIQEAFNLLRQIYVKDTDVEKMAMAKTRLGRAYQMAAQEGEEKEEKDG